RICRTSRPASLICSICPGVLISIMVPLSAAPVLSTSRIRMIIRYLNPGYHGSMVRPPLTDDERARGAALGAALKRARGDRNPAELALAAGISVETLRKIEGGRIPTPAFATVVALARELDLDLTSLAAIAVP